MKNKSLNKFMFIYVHSGAKIKGKITKSENARIKNVLRVIYIKSKNRDK